MKLQLIVQLGLYIDHGLTELQKCFIFEIYTNETYTNLIDSRLARNTPHEWLSGGGYLIEVSDIGGTNLFFIKLLRRIENGKRYSKK